MNQSLIEPQSTAGPLSQAVALSATAHQRIPPRILDAAERWLVAIFFGQVVVRLAYDAWLHANPSALLILPSEGLAFLLILLRSPTQSISLRCSDWLFAVCGTVLPTLVVGGSQSIAPGPAILLACLALVGFIVQIHAKLSLGKSLGLVAANRGIRRSGPYRHVRHPMYAGYFLGQCAFLLANGGVWNLAILSAATVFQILRIRAEERLLRHDPEYVTYCEQVRDRLIPGLY